MIEKWIVVADSYQCLVYEQKFVESAYFEKFDLVHAECSMRVNGAMMDRPEYERDDTGLGPQLVFMKLDAGEYEKELFAREICDQLEEGRSLGAFRHLAVAAPPSFLGKLRDEMSDELGSMVVAKVNRDLTGLKPVELQAYI